VPGLIAATVDGAFLVVVAGIVWREIAAGKVWDRTPIGVLISLYAIANLLFHALHLHDGATDLAERIALAVLMILLALIGGRIAPGFTEDFLEEAGLTLRPTPFSYFDGISVMFVAAAGFAWTMAPEVKLTGWLLIGGGLVAAGLGVFLRQRFNRWYAESGGPDAAPQLRYLFPKPLAEYSPSLLSGLAFIIVLYSTIESPSLDLAVIRIALGIFLFGVACVIIDWATGPLSPSASIKGLVPDHVRPLRRRPFSIGSL